ncbi:uroporphyrinogen-III synthase [Halalkalirubrum salinum]|uniref:uroporphyrinogen-III synthase n=1 Tax=Halalkalirubrum salinum TaxID=2563889 RepID=UPI0010FB5711|nr:uroporphyrinogen-III synthase [Halalkalirubrum salinum]
MTDRPCVAVFRPDDERIDAAVETLESLGVDAVADPMLAIEPTGTLPGSDAEFVVFTSKTGVELVAEAGWDPGDATLCVIGPKTADAARAVDWTVDVVPETFTSAGLVEVLAEQIQGAHVEVARSDHGSDVLLAGLDDADAKVTETVLYRLSIPESAGRSIELAVAGDLDGAAFTSSLTIEHFLTVADRTDDRAAAIAGLEDAVVGAIGPPTAETATAAGIDVDVIPEDATFDALAEAVSKAITDDE